MTVVLGRPSTLIDRELEAQHNGKQTFKIKVVPSLGYQNFLSRHAGLKSEHIFSVNKVKKNPKLYLI